MGDVIDFTAEKKRLQEKAEAEAPAPSAGEEMDLEYPAKPGSVAVGLSCDADGTAHFTVTAPAEDVGQAISEARAALLANFGIDPSDLTGAEAVRMQLGAASFDAFVTTFVQQHFLGLALQRTKIMPFLTPDLLTDDVPEAGHDYVFQVETLLRPTIALTSYDPVSVELPEKADISSKDVSAYLDNMADELATWEEDPARDSTVAGDHVSLNLDAETSDGRTFQPLTGRHVPSVIGAGMVGEEFDRQLVGMKPRERRAFSVSIPVPASDGKVGYQVVQVKAQLDAIQHKVPARIDDAWVLSNMPEAQTLLGLRSRIRTLLEKQAEAAYHDELMVRTADALAERLQEEPAERYIEKMRDEMTSQYMEDLAQRGVSYQQLVSQPGFDMGAWQAQIDEQARASLRRGLALDALADHLDINLDREDIVKVVSQMAPGHEQEAYQGLVESGQMPKMCEVALRTRANEWLVDHVADSAKPRFEGGVLLGGGAPAALQEKKEKKAGDGPRLQLL